MNVISIKISIFYFIWGTKGEILKKCSSDLLKELVTYWTNHSGWFCEMIHWKDLAQKNDSFTNPTLLLLSWTLQIYTEWQPNFWSENKKTVTEFLFLSNKKKPLIFVDRIKVIVFACKLYLYRVSCTMSVSMCLCVCKASWKASDKDRE